MKQIQHISAIDAYKKIQEGAILIDVRDEDEIKEISCDVENVLYIPLNKLEEGVKNLLKEEEYIMMCYSGGRSFVATQLMYVYGFEEVYNLQGGISAWDIGGLPTK